jgi:hypothetical protein
MTIFIEELNGLHRLADVSQNWDLKWMFFLLNTKTIWLYPEYDTDN